MKEPSWLLEEDIQAIYLELIREHGGAAGLRDEGLLSASIARPRHLLGYQVDVDLFDLAAAYGYAFAKNHCFIDGNKRIALAAIAVFLEINRFELVAPEVEAVKTIYQLAEGALEQEELANWLRVNFEAI